MTSRSPRFFASRSLAAAALLAYSSILSAQRGVGTTMPQNSAATLIFSGTSSADLFTHEIDASFYGVLDNNFVPTATKAEPAGFVNASLAGYPWYGTMWTRDAGTYLRELTMWGDYKDASLLAQCLMHLVEKNKEGYYFYPRYFRGRRKASGTELDGTSAVVIGLVLLWNRLPDHDATRRQIQSFLLDENSPIAYFRVLLKAQPLLAGTGEFGCGMRVPGECDNVVQNNLVRLALLAFSGMEKSLGMTRQAADDYSFAQQIRRNMEKYLVAADGAWLWAINSTTLAADPKVLNAKTNLGFGGTNGVAAMDADVLGLQSLESDPDVMKHSEKTFYDLYKNPRRQEQFDRFGIWTQFDEIGGGVLTSPSYGQGYALQTMLLMDHLTMADKALTWLADATYHPIPGYRLSRSSPYFFYERYYSPEAPGRVDMAVGCGALNLVNVTEPLKVARLILGVDDSNPASTLLLPRLPSSWTTLRARNWPILTTHGVIRADISFQRSGSGGILRLNVLDGAKIDRVRVRMPSSTGYVWRQKTSVKAASFRTH